MNRAPVANRSFLHGDRKSDACSEKLVYATLDSLALKRTRLPLQLLPTEIESDNAVDTLEEDGTCTVPHECEASSPISTDQVENSIYSKVLCTGNENIETTRICASESNAFRDNEKETSSFELYERVEAERPINDPRPITPDSSAAAEKHLKKPCEQSILKYISSTSPKKKKHFAKNVLRAYFAQTQLAKRPKKKRRRKQRQDPPFDTIAADSNDRTAKGKKRLWSPRSISSPTNFVHVASATVPNRAISQESAFSWPALDKVVITYKEKCATLPPLNRRIEARSVLSGASLEDDCCRLKLKVKSCKLSRSKSSVFGGGTSERFVNHSFLWSSRSRGVLPSRESGERWSRTDNEADSSTEQYDDVLPTPISVSQSQEYMYDDVGLSKTEPLNEADDSADEAYDDVIVIRHPAIKSPPEAGLHFSAESSGNEYSSVEEIDKDDEQPLYDDVGFPKPAEERVNSLYYSGSINALNSTSNKESEWEDVDEETLASTSTSSSTSTSTSSSSGASPKNNLWKSTDFQRGASKKKLGPALRAWKATRQRSKRSWRSTQSFGKNSLSRGDSSGEVAHSDSFQRNVSAIAMKQSARALRERPNTQVAVSLGCGSVLLVGGKTDEERQNEEEAIDTGGKADDASDASNYESVRSLQSENETSEPEFESQKKTSQSSNVEVSTGNAVNPNQVPLKLEAPTKPVPPPPREASLTESLGKRIKMLRRTWSITKGSIGRIRRRTSVEVENGCEDGKYFGLARHFRKSAPTLQPPNANSRFYLERGALPNTVCLDKSSSIHSQCYLEHKTSQEALYANWNRHEHAEVRPVSATPSEMILDNIDHYSVFSDQEPLYQFYAAAAARFAYDSPSEMGENENIDDDSDGYEEVRGVVPSKATTELAKPGHRTLWSQTPQIINSGLLQSLTPDEIKTQEAKFEILTSEASYLNSLRVLEKEFLGDPALTEQLLTPAERDKLFGSVPYILQTSETFLADLESVWRTDPILRALPDILLKHAHTYSDAYVTYCSKQVAIDATFKDLRARKGSKFQDALARIEARPSCQSLSLHSFLMLPMQRITRLPLLADAILSKLGMDQTADKRSWENVLSTFSHIVAECNEAARAAAQQAEIEQLTRQLEYPTKIAPILLKGKSLIRSGQVVQLLTKVDAEYKLTFGKKFNKLPLFLFLLTDYLLITKRKTNTSQEEVYLVIDMCKRNLIALERAPEDGAIAGAKNAMLLTLLENYCGQQMNYLLTCESNTERERWLEAVCPCEHGLIGETLYEAWDCPQVVALYSYSPCQPDELLLQPGDVINVLKKMPDGWYQGEKLLSGEQGWFPGNYTKEVASEHVRARNLKQRHRLVTLNGNTTFPRSRK